MDVRDVAEQPIHDIDEVAELREERAAVQGRCAFPSTLLVVPFVAVPVAIQLHHVDVAQQATVNNALDPLARRTVPVLHDTEHGAMHLQGLVDNGFAGCLAEGQRLLAHHMLPVLQGQDALLRMEAIRCTHVHHVDTGQVGQHGTHVLEIRNIECRSTSLFTGANIANGDQLRFDMPCDHFRVTLADVAAADHCEPDLVLSAHAAFDPSARDTFPFSNLYR